MLNIHMTDLIADQVFQQRTVAKASFLYFDTLSSSNPNLCSI
jgi:hypothetical protein